MFVGVVVENFHKCKEALEAEMKERARKKRLERKLKRQQYESEFGQKKKRRNHPFIPPAYFNFMRSNSFNFNYSLLFFNF